VWLTAAKGKGLEISGKAVTNNAALLQLLFYK